MKKILILLFALLTVFGAEAQNNLTLYNMKTVPQRYYTNPARRSDAKVFVGLPMISSNYMDIGFDGFRIKDLTGAIRTEGSDNVFVISDFTAQLKKRNQFTVTQSTDLLSFGFKVKKNYFFVNSTLHNSLKVSFPGDLFKFLGEGNGGANLNRKFDFAFGIDAMQYAEFGVGYSRQLLDEKLTVGTRLRLINGIAVISTEDSELLFSTDKETFDYTLQSNIRINTANSFGQFSINDSNNNPNVSGQDILNEVFGGGNRGFAVDIGAEYKPTERFTLSASINNLGRINWNTNALNIVSENPNATYVYDGIHIDNILDYTDEDFEASLEAIGDTIKDRFNLTETNESFKTGLYAQFYLAGNYNLTKNHNAGILFYGDFYKSTINPAITLSWNSKITRVLGISLTYSVLNGSAANAGLGFSLNGGPIQYYFVSDNLVALFRHDAVRTVNFRTGLNLTIGRKTKKTGVSN